MILCSEGQKALVRDLVEIQNMYLFMNMHSEYAF